MKDNYLWDRSGEPDPEVQKLEEILGTLRYQPQALEIPRHIQTGRRSFAPALAIAAALALFAVLLGLWFGFHRRQTTPALAAKHDSQIDQQVKSTTASAAVSSRQRAFAGCGGSEPEAHGR